MFNVTFKLDPCYEMTIGGESMSYQEPGGGWSGSSSAGSVSFLVTHMPIGQADGPPQCRSRVAAFHLKPSQARAIASAMLSAATEAKD